MGRASGRAGAFSAAAAVVAALAVGGCGSGNHPRSPGMMGAAGAGMSPGLGSGSVYHYSRLTCAAPAVLPGRTVHVLFGDMGMTRMGGTASLGMRMLLRAVPGSVPAGRLSLVAVNRGWRSHELVVLPMAAGRLAGGARTPGSDGKVDESGSVGEASASCAAGVGRGIRPGAVGWTTLTLAPGRYELVCNLPHHYADGMHQVLLVTPS